MFYANQKATDIEMTVFDPVWKVDRTRHSKCVLQSMHNFHHTHSACLGRKANPLKFKCTSHGNWGSFASFSMKVGDDCGFIS